MARLARVVAAGIAHHVIQRGNRRQPVFFSDDDYKFYRGLLVEHCAAADVAVWAYCLMPNHVHMILVPRDKDGLRAALADAHRRYSSHVNRREEWSGYLWQGRFASFPMDEAHTLACARYIEMNPVRAKLAKHPREWPWSSARAHLAGKNDAVVDVAPLLELVPDWPTFLNAGVTEAEQEALRKHSRTGRPLGAERFVSKLERKLGRNLMRAKPGPKPKKRT